MGKAKILIIASTVLLVAGGGGAAFLLVGDNTGNAQAKPAESVAIKNPVYLDLEPITVPVRRNDHKRHVYAVAITLQLSDDKARDRVAAIMPRLQDAFLRQVNGQPIEGGTGTDALDLTALKRRLSQQAETVVGPGQVEDLLFKRIYRLQL